MNHISQDLRIFGWNWDQWAIASARLGRPECVTLQSAMRLRKRWAETNRADPGEVQLIGVDVTMDHDFSCELFSIPVGRP